VSAAIAFAMGFVGFLLGHWAGRRDERRAQLTRDVTGFRERLAEPDPIASVVSLRCPHCGHEFSTATIGASVPETPVPCPSCGKLGRIPPRA
jgi:ribosomal protein S27E